MCYFRGIKMSTRLDPTRLQCFESPHFVSAVRRVRYQTGSNETLRASISIFQGHKSYGLNSLSIRQPTDRPHPTNNRDHYGPRDGNTTCRIIRFHFLTIQYYPWFFSLVFSRSRIRIRRTIAFEISKPAITVYETWTRWIKNNRNYFTGVYVRYACVLGCVCVV